MKIVLLAVGLLVTLVIPANATFKISLYSDPAHQSTQAYDQSPGALSVYVVFEEVGGVNGGTAAFLRIAPSPGFTGVWIGETSPFLLQGASPSGIGVAFPGCILTSQVLEVQYAILGTSEPCSFLEVVAHPEVDIYGGLPVIMDCVLEDAPAIGGKLTINPNSTCSPVPVAPTTWGKIKAMYR